MTRLQDEGAFTRRRQEMVQKQVARRGVSDPQVLDAMRTTPRHRFVPVKSLADAYKDHPLSIGHGQTISQPYMVAHMVELLQPRREDVALEVGAGCGYGAAVLACIVKKVYAVEVVPELAETAARNLQELGIENVQVASFDASGGWPEKAPFDDILVSAGAPEIPEALKEQLALGGRLVIPAGVRSRQQIRVVERQIDETQIERGLYCRFVDLRGRHGWE